MYKIITTLLMSSFIASSASASIANNVVETTNRTYLFDSNGSCIRTKWMVPGDKCTDEEIVESVDLAMIQERVTLFDFAQHDLKPEYIETLNKLIEILDENKITHLKIVGYTDRIGSDAFNQKLAQRRADTVRDYLNTHMKLDSSVVELRAMGKTDEYANCEGHKGAQLISCLMPNRRVEVEIDYNFHDKKTVVIPWKERMNNPDKYDDDNEDEKATVPQI
ncbi:MAG: OmpA family protein [Rickettsiales bacterium]